MSIDESAGKKGESAFRRELKKYTTSSKPHHCLVEAIEITAPCALLEEGVQLIDTPGLDDTERFRVNLTEKAVQDVDAVLFLTKSGAAYGQSEKDFLLSLLRKGTVKQLIFVITQIDQTYAQHVRQARDQDEDPDPLSNRIEIERKRLQREIDETLTALTENAESQAVLRYREQLGNIDIVFTSAANHRDWKSGEGVKHPLYSTDPGGLESVKSTLLRILSTESRLANSARNIESGARLLLDNLISTIESRRSAVRNIKDREIAEQKLGMFREKLKAVSEQFSSSTQIDSEVFVHAVQARIPFSEIIIENITLQADVVLSSYETDDAGRHWRTRRCGNWGYMHQLQGRVANAIFPKVAELLSHQTTEFVSFIDKFKKHLNILSDSSTHIADEIDIGSTIHIGIESRLVTFLEQSLQDAETLIEVEQEKILRLLDDFVSEEVSDLISDARERVSDVWGRGTTAVQTSEVKSFYKEVKVILRKALFEHVRTRFSEFSAYLRSIVTQLPLRAISEAEAELEQAEHNIRAAATAAVQGQKEQFEHLANILTSEIEGVLGEIRARFGNETVHSSLTVEENSETLTQEDQVTIDTKADVNIEAVHDIKALNHDELRKIPEVANEFCLRYSLTSGKAGVSYQKIFTSKLIAGSNSALLIDPYLNKPHQIRNLIEFVDAILENVKVKNLYLETSILPPDLHKDIDEIYGKLSKDFFEQGGVNFEWRRVTDIHDRYAIFDNGVMFKLGRGLDIFKPALGLALKNQVIRKVKDCTIDVFRIPML